MIFHDHIKSEFQNIGYPLAGSVALRPELKVLRTIIVAYSVLVMDRFWITKRSAKEFSHNDNMLRNVSSLSCVRMIRDPYFQISVFGSKAASVRRTLANQCVSVGLPSPVVFSTKPPGNNRPFARTNLASLLFFRDRVKRIAIFSELAKMSYTIAASMVFLSASFYAAFMIRDAKHSPSEWVAVSFETIKMESTESFRVVFLAAIMNGTNLDRLAWIWRAGKAVFSDSLEVHQAIPAAVRLSMALFNSAFGPHDNTPK